jgi:hypothetical protein
VYLCDCTTERGPTSLIDGECHYLLSICDEMSPENGPNSRRGAGALELHGAVDSVGIGTSHRSEAPRSRSLGEHLGTGDPDTKGEVGVDVEVSEHFQ